MYLKRLEEAQKGLETMLTCKRCKGKGHYMVANGPDDVDHECCDDCDGTGLITRKGTK